MIKKHLGITSLLSICCLLVAACSSNSTSSTATTTENAAPKEIILDGVDNPFFQDLLVKQFPQYHFTFYKGNEKPSLQDLVAQGTPIDMVMESYGQFTSPGYALSLGLQYDMTDLAKKHKFDLSRFDQSPIQGIQGLGGLYGIPIYINPLVLFYNKDIFDKFGVAYPKDGMTWDQISELAKKFDQNVDGVQYVGFATDVDHPWNSNQLSIPYVDPKTGNASIGTADWQSKWKELIQTYILNFTSDPGYQNYLKSKNPFFGGPQTPFEKDKNVAMMLWFPNQWNNNPAYSQMNWDMVSMPTIKDAPGIGPQPYPTFMFICASSKNKDDDMKIIEYLTSDQVQSQISRQGNVTPLINSAVRKEFGQDSPFKDKNFQAIFYNRFAAMPKATIYDQVVQRGMHTDLDKLINQTEDMNTYLQAANDAANKSIVDTKQQGGVRQN